MANLPELLSVPDGNAFHRLMFKKCLPRVKFFHSNFGAELFVHDVIDSFYPSKFDNSRYADIKPGDLATILEAYRMFITKSINLELTKDQIVSDLRSCGVVDDVVIGQIVSAMFGRLEELKTKFSNDAIKLNKNYLVDFDWKVNLTLSGDVIAQCREPVLLLQLKLAENDQSPTNDLLLELNAEELDTLIATMENASTFLSKLQY